MWSGNNFAMPSFLNIANLESNSSSLWERKVIQLHSYLILPSLSYISIHVHNYERKFHYIPSLKYQLVLTLGVFLTNELFF